MEMAAQSQSHIGAADRDRRGTEIRRHAEFGPPRPKANDEQAATILPARREPETGGQNAGARRGVKPICRSDYRAGNASSVFRRGSRSSSIFSKR